MADSGVHSVIIGNVTADVILGGITSHSVTTNNETIDDGSGATFVQSRSIKSHAPVQTFTTTAIGAALGVLSPNGSCIESPGVVESITSVMQRKTDCASGIPGANSHTRYSITRGLVVPKELSASLGENATLSVETHGLTDSTGANAPLAVAHNQAIPSSVDISQYILGAVRVGGVVFGDASSVGLSFGLALTEKRLIQAGTYPLTVSVQRVDPVLTVSGTDLTRLDSGAIPLLGKASVHTDTEFWLRKRLDGSALVPVATTEHIKISMSGLASCEEAASASGADSASTTFKVESTYDGTNNPVVVSINVAYAPGF